MANHRRHGRGVALAVFGFWLAACNGILGIDEATLDSGGTGGASLGSGGQSSVIPSRQCSVTESCQACLSQSCSTASMDCLRDGTCRAALDAYRICLGNSCQDNPAKDCLEDVDMYSTVGARLVTCFQDSCSQECRGSAFASECELYCSCMPDHCPEKVGQTDTAACMAKCITRGATRPDLPWCRWKHCEFARPENASLHCEHAVGGNGECTDTGPVLTPCLKDSKGAPNGIACNVNSDCCSGVCSNQVCTAA